MADKQDDADQPAAGEEADGPVEPPAAEDAGAQTEKPTGATEIDPGLDFEVVILALSAVREIAAEIALRVSHWAGEDGPATLVILADEGFAARLFEWQALAIRMGVLETAMEKLLRDRKPATAGLEGLLAPIAGASAAMEAVAQLLAYFKADTEYSGRDVALDDSVLFPAIAGQLIEEGIQVVFGSHASFGIDNAQSTGLIARLERLLLLRAELVGFPPDTPEHGSDIEEQQDSASSGGPLAQGVGVSAPTFPEPEHGGTGQEASGSDGPSRQARALADAVDKLVNELSAATEGKTRTAALQAASRVTTLIGATSKACMLTPKFLKAGGHYRKRKHLFTTLFWGDQLSYSGGAAISFVMTDLKSRRVVVTDVLYHASGNVRFPDEVRELEPSNLTRRQGLNRG